jgi:hypothetical protein
MPSIPECKVRSASLDLVIRERVFKGQEEGERAGIHVMQEGGEVR